MSFEHAMIFPYKIFNLYWFFYGRPQAEMTFMAKDTLRECSKRHKGWEGKGSVGPFSILKLWRFNDLSNALSCRFMSLKSSGLRLETKLNLSAALTLLHSKKSSSSSPFSMIFCLSLNTFNKQPDEKFLFFLNFAARWETFSTIEEFFGSSTEEDSRWWKSFSFAGERGKWW